MAAPLRYLEPLSRSANIMALVAIKIGRRQGASSPSRRENQPSDAATAGREPWYLRKIDY
jgi:hypothetical protein